MPTARKHQIALQKTPYYHVISRCVRRAFLCGQDAHSGRSFEHRRAWVGARIAQLIQCFAVDLYAYAIMSNHYHLVVRVDASAAAGWSDEAVIQRWAGVFSGNELARRYLAGEPLDNQAHQALSEQVPIWRTRLADLSWFMRALNEGIARAANAEDCCRGRVWEGRFQCQALLDQQAVLNCMAYVNLNPVRAAMASTPEESDYTSIQQRIHEHHQNTATSQAFAPATLPQLAPLERSGANSASPPFSISTEAYLTLVDASGRSIRAGKRGHVPEHCLPILERLALKPAVWSQRLCQQLRFFPRALGNSAAAAAFAEATGRKWIWRGC